MQPQNNSGLPLKSPFVLIKEAFQIYFKEENLWYLVKVVLISLLLGIILISLFLPFYLSGVKMGDVRSPLIILSHFVFLLGAIIIGVWVQASQIQAVVQVRKNKIIGVIATYKLAWKKVWKFFWTTFLAALAIAFGFILLIIPGVIFAIWFSFSRYIVVSEELGVIDSIKKSKELVSGYFWGVLGRVIIFALLGAIIGGILSIIPFAGMIVLIIFIPFFILLNFLLYENLKEIKGSGPPAQESG